MNLAKRLCAVALVVAGLATGQTAQFEVASLRPVPPVAGNQAVTMGLKLDGQQVRISSFSLRDLIGMAYQLDRERVTGPESLETRYELQATIPAGAKADQLSEMIQSLLAERFALKFHRDMPEVAVYVLGLGKGPLALKEVEAAAEEPTGRVEAGGTGSANGVAVSLGNGAGYSFANGKWEGRRLTAAQFADQISVYLDKPVVEQTGLTGRYDVTVELAQEDAQLMMLRAAKRSGYVLPPQLLQRMDAMSFNGLEAAFEKIGLKLESRKLPQTRIVVDSVRATPTEN